MKAPYLIDNFLTADQCKTLIEFGLTHEKRHSGIQENVVRGWKRVSDIVSDEGSDLQNMLQAVHEAVGKKIVDVYECYDAKPRDYGYFYEYSMGDFYQTHCDAQTIVTKEGMTAGFRKASSSDVSSVLYLNDNFVGGDLEFVFAGKRVRPKAGRLLLFYGGWENAHCVHPIELGKRYCVVNWYETKKKLVPNVEPIPSPYAEHFAMLEANYDKLR